MKESSMKEEQWTDRCERYFQSLETCEKKESEVTKSGTSKSSGATPSVVEEKNKWLGFCPTSLNQWISCMDLHGTSFIASSTSLITVLFWVIVCATGLSSLTYLITVRVQYYLSSKSHFDLVQNNYFDPSLDVPLTLSVCNLNILRISTLEGSRFEPLLDSNIQSFGVGPARYDYHKLESLTDTAGTSLFIDKVREEYREYRKRKTLTNWETSAGYMNIGSFLRPSREELQRHGMRPQDDLLRCVADGTACQRDMIHYRTNGYEGNCLYFNMSTMLGPHFVDRVSLIMHTRPEEYIGLMTSSSGFRVRVHPSNSQSKNGKEFFVSPGSALNLNLAKVSVYERQVCKSGHSFQECEENCLHSLTQDICGCSTSIDAEDRNRCRPEYDEYQYVCSRVLEMMSSRTLLPCNCEKDCREVDLDVSSTVLPWPSEHHMEYLRKDMEINGYSGNESEIRKELVRIDLSTSGLLFDRFEERSDMMLLSLLAEVGGFSALLCGVSLITCLQIFIGLVKLSVAAFQALVYGKSENKGVQKLKETDVTATWSQKGTSQDNLKKLQSSTTFLSTLTPLGQSSLDPIKEVETPRTEDHTYEAISSPRDETTQPGQTTLKTGNGGFPSRSRMQWRSLEGPGAGRERWRKPTFPVHEKTGLENKVFYGSNDDLNKHLSRFVNERNDWDGFNTMPSPRRQTRGPERPSIPPLNFTKMDNADGYWIDPEPSQLEQPFKRTGSGSRWIDPKPDQLEQPFTRTGSGSQVLSWSDFARQYGVPKAETNTKSQSKNIFYM